MYSDHDLHKGGVSPFGHPRINDRSHLPAAFRSVPRPSSPLGAKASTERPSFTLTLHRPHAGPTRRDPYPNAPSPHVQSDSRHREHSLKYPKSTTQPPRHAPSSTTQRKAAIQGYSTHHSIFTCQRTRETTATRSPQPHGLFPEDDAADPGAGRTRSYQIHHNPNPCAWLGDGRYRTDDPLLAKQALSH
jgi:hypothetical protein